LKALLLKTDLVLMVDVLMMLEQNTVAGLFVLGFLFHFFVLCIRTAIRILRLHRLDIINILLILIYSLYQQKKNSPDVRTSGTRSIGMFGTKYWQ
jgi:hypothetical protein